QLLISLDLSRLTACSAAEELPDIGGKFQRPAPADGPDARVFDHPRRNQAGLLLGTQQDHALRPHLRRYLLDLLSYRVGAVLRCDPIQLVECDQIPQSFGGIAGPELLDTAEHGGDHEPLKRGCRAKPVKIDDERSDNTAGRVAAGLWNDERLASWSVAPQHAIA